jgi:hypothetical protein
LRVFDVDEVETHGGSLRVYGCHADNDAKPTKGTVNALLKEEIAAGLKSLDRYRRFAEQVVEIKCQVLDFFVDARRAGKKVAAYGAPAKGNTLLNYCGIGRELLDYTVDRSPHKQGLYLPGTHIPILSPDAIPESKPDYLFILPWNLRTEIVEQMAGIRSWGGKFVVPIPALEIF